MKQIKTSLALAFSLAALAGTQAACMDHKIGGKTIAEVFSDPGLAQMTEAACRGDAKEVGRLAASGVNPSGVGLDGVPPLFWAINCENLMGMEALLTAGADPNYVIPSHFSLMYQAATFRDSRILKMMLRHGGDANLGIDSEEWPIKTAIFHAGDTDNWENYYLILNSNYDLNKHDSTGMSAAIILASMNRWDKVEELLDRGYNFDLQDLAKSLEFLGPGGRREEEAKERVAKRLTAMGLNVPDWLGRKK